MVAYVIQLAKEIVAQAAKQEAGLLSKLLRVLPEELDRLDPRDFLPSARYDFIMVRLDARERGRSSTIGSGSFTPITDLANRVIAVLDQFGGENSRVVSRSFAFITNLDLRQIVERDYRELRLKVFPSQAWKSTVVLAGSVLEAILFDQLAAVAAKANASKRAPKDKKGIVRDLLGGDWKLVDLIEVSSELGILPADRAKSIDQVLRDYRNFVHPMKELRAQHPCTEAEALMSVGALEGVCNVLE